MVKIIEKLRNIFMPIYRINDLPEFLVSVKRKKKIVIFTTKHCIFVANLLADTLNKMNINTTIIFKKPKWGYSDLPHIVVCPYVSNDLPVNYIAFQMEQSESSNWFSQEYFIKLNKAVAVFDYSLQNVEYLKKHLENANKIFYLPLSINKKFLNKYSEKLSDRKYDVLFYGGITSLRREKILDKLKSKYRVKIITDKFGEDLYNELSSAKIIVNIHFYENALLETTRLCECLSLNNNVIISERGRDQEQHTFLEEFIDFVDDGDIDGLVHKIDYYLSDNNLMSDKINKNKISLANLTSTEFENKLKCIFKL